MFCWRTIKRFEFQPLCVVPCLVLFIGLRCSIHGKVIATENYKNVSSLPVCVIGCRIVSVSGFALGEQLISEHKSSCYLFKIDLQSRGHRVWSPWRISRTHQPTSPCSVGWCSLEIQSLLATPERQREWDVCLQALFNRFLGRTLRTLVWHRYVSFPADSIHVRMCFGKAQCCTSFWQDCSYFSNYFI